VLNTVRSCSYLRLIDFVYHSTLGLRVIKRKRRSCPEILSRLLLRTPFSFPFKGNPFKPFSETLPRLPVCLLGE